VDAVLYRCRAGILWRDLPECFGDFPVVHTRHSRWSRRGGANSKCSSTSRLVFEGWFT
jgi:transposase